MLQKNSLVLPSTLVVDTKSPVSLRYGVSFGAVVSNTLIFKVNLGIEMELYKLYCTLVAHPLQTQN